MRGRPFDVKVTCADLCPHTRLLAATISLAQILGKKMHCFTSPPLGSRNGHA